ncbi:MAG: thiamine-phosphate kinase [Desulfobacca sp.]|uniref:thiamine-phosphate kinase n=1 Tax=Desulfobacca sp. TaxID=2067990 RepID=UPI004048F9EE
MAGERGLIDALRRIFGPAPAGVVCGIGDDTAILAPQPGQDLLWTIDTLVEGVHFDLSYTSLRSLGWKALAVNLSDIAAMGGEPQYALLALGWPPSRGLNQALELARGMQEAAARYGVALIGGDTVAAPAGLTLSLTVLGQVSPGMALRRDGAQVGDEIYVTGSLGLAAAGLEVLRHGLALPSEEQDNLTAAFLRPLPQLAVGRLLAGHRLATAAIDLSDGVASDLEQICLRSGVGAVLLAEALPIPWPVSEVAQRLGLDPCDLALKGGEDYQLLFTVRPENRALLLTAFVQAGLPAPSCIGSIVAGAGIRLRRPAGEEEIAGTGFDHFPDASLTMG